MVWNQTGSTTSEKWMRYGRVKRTKSERLDKTKKVRSTVRKYYMCHISKAPPDQPSFVSLITLCSTSQLLTQWISFCIWKTCAGQKNGCSELSMIFVLHLLYSKLRERVFFSHREETVGKHEHLSCFTVCVLMVIWWGGGWISVSHLCLALARAQPWGADSLRCTLLPHAVTFILQVSNSLFV